MYFDGEYRRIGDIDVTALREFVSGISEDVWYADTVRQQVFAAHRQTQSIGLIFDPDMRHEAPTVHPIYHQFKDLITPATATVIDHFANAPPPGITAGTTGYFVRILLVRLNGEAKIGSHRDHGESLSRAHRIHLPIVTNPGAEFGIAGRIQHLAAGELWEINNRKLHAVRNAGSARIHLIMDYVLPGEMVSDPEGILIA